MSRRWTSRIIVLSLGTTFAAGLVLVPTVRSASANSDEAAFVVDTNAAREAHGLAPLAVHADLTSIARNWSAQMAATRTLEHNPNLTGQVQNWQAVGENVGYGPDEPHIQNAFMTSPDHRSNILDPDYTQLGVGTARDDRGQLWVTIDFRQPATITAPTAQPATSRIPNNRAPSHMNMTATAILRARLRALQAALHKRHIPDPISQTFYYLIALRTLIAPDPVEG